MRRLLPFTLWFLAFSSLLGSVLCLILWPLSYGYLIGPYSRSATAEPPDCIRFVTVAIDSCRGCIDFSFSSDRLRLPGMSPPPAHREFHFRKLRPGHDTDIERHFDDYVMGFGFNHRNFHFPGNAYTAEGWHRWLSIGIPHWLATIVLAIFPFFMLRRHRRIRREQQLLGHLCPSCDYDLRAHPAGAKCPECGMVIADSATQSV